MNNQKLAEFAGVGWHERGGEKYGQVFCSCGLWWHSQHNSDLNPDFTTWSGYGLLHDELTERGEWGVFREWLVNKWKNSPNIVYVVDHRFVFIEYNKLSRTDKSKLISDALEAGVLEVE